MTKETLNGNKNKRININDSVLSKKDVALL